MQLGSSSDSDFSSISIFDDTISQNDKFNEESILAYYIPDAEEISNFNKDLEVTSPLLEHFSCIHHPMTKKVSLCAIAISFFGISTVIASNWAYKTKVLDAAMLVNGLSVAAICALLLPPDILKSINAKTTHWSYESLFLVTQIFINLVPKKAKGTIGSLFSWVFGGMEGKDILHIMTTHAELPLSSLAPEEKDLMKMVGFSTQNIKGRNVSMLALLITGIALSILDFVWLKAKYQEYDDFGKLGVYQDFFAILTFIPLAVLSTGYLCDRKRILEKEYYNSMLEGKPETWSLKIANLISKALILTSPIITISTLAINSPPNRIEAYFLIGIGAFSTAQAAFISREEFENPNSPLHDIKAISDIEEPQILAMKEKIVSWMQKYGASLLFEIGFIGFFIAVLVESPKDWIAISGTIFMSILSFICTDRLAAHYQPARNNRILNEIAFHVLYFPLWLSFVYEYITTKLDIDDQNLNHNSLELYAMATAGWWTLGALIGINRAIHIQDKTYSIVESNPAIFTMEMTKFLYNRFNV
ncbi:MAG: hypothetical protein H0T62_07745 [Parachlamydiaceae bacterium]|nr:hypothetical protein [Parachlamydiaceae bacterium]